MGLRLQELSGLRLLDGATITTAGSYPASVLADADQKETGPPETELNEAPGD